MNVFAILGAAAIAAIVYFLIFHSPSNDLVFSGESDAQVEAMRAILEENGIKTYAKNLHSQGLVARRGGALGNPSLHVVHQSDYQRALKMAAAAGDKIR